MLEMSLVGNCQVSQGKQMQPCISQVWVSSKSQRKLQVFKFSFWFLSFSSSSMEAKIIFWNAALGGVKALDGFPCSTWLLPASRWCQLDDERCWLGNMRRPTPLPPTRPQCHVKSTLLPSSDFSKPLSVHLLVQVVSSMLSLYQSLLYSAWRNDWKRAGWGLVSLHF